MGNNGNGASSLIILALPLLLIGWMFWSANRRQKQMRQFSSSLSVGDQVVTSSGVFGTVRHLDDISAHLEVAEGTIIRFDRRAVAMRQAEVASGASEDARPAGEPTTKPGDTPDSGQ